MDPGRFGIQDSEWEEVRGKSDPFDYGLIIAFRHGWARISLFTTNVSPAQITVGGVPDARKVLRWLLAQHPEIQKVQLEIITNPNEFPWRRVLDQLQMEQVVRTGRLGKTDF